MSKDETKSSHSAEGSAVGFWYQSLYALKVLAASTADDGAICIEQLDDIEFKVDGQTLLYQLKHSISDKPPSISLKSAAFWRTIKVWIDTLPQLTLTDVTLHLVTVGGIADDSPLGVLTDDSADREDLLAEMTEEAERVRDARTAAKQAGKTLPYSERADGCDAFLSLNVAERLSLLRRVVLRSSSPAAADIESELASTFTWLRPANRQDVAKRLIEWWDRQVLYSLCGKRDRVISRLEFQSQLSELVADIEQEKLVPDFETLQPPDDYQPNGMLTRQIELVKGTKADIGRAIREEWRAREQRGRWATANPAIAAKIIDYDQVLLEHWFDLHQDMVQKCAAVSDDAKCVSGLELLRWTHYEAPKSVRAISAGWTAAYYVRGSYQVLAIDLLVGWHPEFKTLLSAD
jgi:hypothetical protein